MGPAQPKGQSLPGWWPAAPLSGVDGRGFCHQHPGRQLLSLPGRELFRGRRVGMWAWCQVQPPLQCKRKVLSSQPGSFVASPAGWNGPSPAGPKTGCLNPNFPSAVSLRIWVPSVGPERRGRQAGREERFWNLLICQLCVLGLVSAYSGPQFPPHNMTLIDHAIQMDFVCCRLFPWIL